MKQLLLILCISFAYQIGVAATPSYLDEKSTELRKKELNSEALLEKLKVDLPVVEEKWHEERSKQASNVLPTADTAGSVGGGLSASMLWEQVKLIRQLSEVTQFLKKMYQKHRSIRADVIEVSQETSIETLNNISDSISALTHLSTNQLSWVKSLAQYGQYELKSVISFLESDSIASDVSAIYNRRKQVLEHHVTNDSIALREITNTIKEIDEYQQKIDLLLENKSFTMKALAVIGVVKKIWNYPVYQNEAQPITIGKILIVFFLIIFGLKVASKISRLVSRYIFEKFKIEQGVVDAGEKLFFYAFTLGFVMYALHLMQFPLTAFTFAGGALALGIGFGSQNVINNFISGIILLLERPIKTKDLVEVDGAMGEVESIGLRSTRIRTSGNTHMVLPNSSFLEKNVINWTLSDRKVRLEISVGVAYGSSVTLVRTLLLEVIKESTDAYQDPPANVLFNDFGDSALLFSVLFWIKIQKLTDRRIVMSSLRFKIYEKFAEHGVVIAFPQMDVHLIPNSGDKK